MADEIRPYQEEAIQAAIDRGNLLLALVMGSGKTRVAIEIIKRLRQQRQVVGASAFVQNSTKFQWAREVEKWDDEATVQVINGTKRQRTLQFHRAHEFSWTILNYEALVHDWDLIQEFLPIDAVVADECFPGWVEVDTPNGPRRIDEIAPGDEVVNATGVGVVRAVSRKQSAHVVRVVFEDFAVTCTPGHKFLTTEGWRAARLLHSGSRIVSTNEAMRMVREAHAHREDLSVDRPPYSEDREVLREILLSEVEDAADIGAACGVHRRAAAEDQRQAQGLGGLTVTRGTIPSSISSQGGLDQGVHDSAEGDLEGQRQHDPGSAWQRERADGSRATTAGQPAGVEVEPRHLPGEASPPWVPDQLQGRPGSRGGQDRRRGRRAVPQPVDPQGTGPEEGRHVVVTRVDRLAVHEPGDHGEPGAHTALDQIDVYNLEVTGHPSYSVRGVLVHNCTLIKSFKAKRTKRIKALSGFAGYRYAMSGQPVENRPEELFSIMEFVDAKVLGPFYKFDRTFVTRDAFGRPLRYKNLDVLQERLGDAMYRRSRKDLEAYLPKLQTIETPVLLDAWSQKLYEYIRLDLLDVIDMAVAAGVGGFDLASNYGRGGGLDEQGNQFKGMIMSRVTCMRLLCDHPQLLLHSAENFDDPDIPKGSAFASEMQGEGRLDNAPLTSPKLDLLMLRIQEALGEDAANKVVVFSGFKPMLSLIGMELRKAKIKHTRIDGDVPSKTRDERIVRFNTDPTYKVFLSSDAGAYGVNLDSGSHLVSYDLPWSSGTFSQRVARIDRLSSVHDGITIDNMFCEGTIEERQYAMLQQKRKVSEAFVDGQFDAQGALELNLSSLRKFLEET